jgi:cytoskeletal protein CcmA (bactofilin family)
LTSSHRTGHLLSSDPLGEYMFKKSTKPAAPAKPATTQAPPERLVSMNTPAPAPMVAPPRPANPKPTRQRSVLQSDLQIDGDISGAGMVDLAGSLVGNIDVQGLVLQAEGRIQGHVHAPSVTIDGSIIGTIRAESVVISSTGRIKADILADRLDLQSGAKIIGALSIKPSA